MRYQLSILTVAAPDRVILIPTGTPAADGHTLRGAGWITVAALEPAADPIAEARRMGCSHVYAGGETMPVDQE